MLLVRQTDHLLLLLDALDEHLLLQLDERPHLVEGSQLKELHVYDIGVDEDTELEPTLNLELDMYIYVPTRIYPRTVWCSNLFTKIIYLAHLDVLWVLPYVFRVPCNKLGTHLYLFLI